jgi:hypothetical protein
MSGNCKPRAKTEEEKAHDLAMVIEKIDKCVESCVELVDELDECGDAWLSSVRKARGSISGLEWARQVMNQAKVGEEWDGLRNITGAYYYNDV